jgi:tRNA(Met) cytidine acetyltransferase
MRYFHSYIQHLMTLANESNQRIAMSLSGGEMWVSQCVGYLQSQFHSEDSIWFGCKHSPSDGFISFDKGRLFLGCEYKLIIVDLSSGFDANSFCALMGTLSGGGILCFIHKEALGVSLGERWLFRALHSIIAIDELVSSPDYPIPSLSPTNERDVLSHQSRAIDKILNVFTGHRNRPLVLTADRGRGKTSALGIAAAKVMQLRDGVKVLICASNFKSVETAFRHAGLLLGTGEKSGREIKFGSSCFSFIAPDSLVAQNPECDLLFVDESAALPIPMLEHIATHFHRVVFSSTQHGYEGSGRGFTLKFMKWLSTHRPEFSHLHIKQPIRWAQGDYLESWINQTFFIDQTSLSCPIRFDEFEHNIQFRAVDKVELFHHPELFREIFSILVNAHYQTTPNDLLLILNDDAISVYIAEWNGCVASCALVCREGDLTQDIIKLIQLGQRRPRGHLVPVTLANQLGFPAQASLSCDRILRIATHPQLQGQGIGRSLVRYLCSSSSADYLATSFGLTDELYTFWRDLSFVPIKLGSKRDQSSGTYSILFIYPNGQEWVNTLVENFSYVFTSHLSLLFSRLEINLVRMVLRDIVDIVTPFSVPWHLIESYALGGSNYESVDVWIRNAIYGNPQLVIAASDLIIFRVLQNHSWSDCADKFSLAGRKAVESQLRVDLLQWHMNLHCKD